MFVSLCLRACFLALLFVFFPTMVGAQTASTTIGVGPAVLVVDNAKVPETVIDPSGTRRRVLDSPLTTHISGGNRYWWSSTYNTLSKFSGTLDAPFSTLLWTKPFSSVVSSTTPNNSYWIVNMYSEPSAPAPTTYTHASGYSLVQGTNQWSYEYKGTAGYQPMTLATPPWGGTEKVWKGPETYLMQNASFIHPGDTHEAVIKWTAPFSGTARITGVAKDTDASCGDGVTVKVLKGSTSIWSATIGNGSSKTHDLTQTVSAGDSLYFVVGKNANSFCDSTQWSPTVSLQGAPGLLAFLHVETPRFENGAYFTGKGRIGLAWSNDNGESFRFLGNILSPYGDQNDFNMQGLPYIVKDDYFYVYDFDACGGTNKGIARAKVAEVLTAARLGTTTPWKKYLNGAWNSSGLGGACTSATIEDGINHTDAAKSSYDGAYYMVHSMMNWNGSKTWLKLYRSTDGISWTPVKTIVEEPGASVPEGYQYVSIVDESGADNGVVGQKFYIYSAKDPYHNARVYRWKINLAAPVLPAPSSLLTGYSLTQGANQWSYLYSTSTGYGAMTASLPPWGGTEKVWKGNETYLLIAKTFMHPGDKADAVVKWTAPASGSVQIAGTVTDTDTSCGDGVTVKVLKGSTSIWSATIGNGSSKTHDLTQTVAAGDSLYFVVGKNTNHYCDATAWTPTLTYLEQ